MDLENLKLIANEIKSLEQPIKIISANTPDAVTATTILAKILKNQEKTFSISFYERLNQQIIKEINLDPCYNITLIGIKFSKEILNKRIIEIPQQKSLALNLYLISKFLIKKPKENVYLACIGVISKNLEIKSEIEELFDDAVLTNEIEIKKGLIVK